jgi:transcriptional regulator with XRE-family HTH domain
MFSGNLKRLREAAGLSQSGLAIKLGMPATTLQNWEQGRRKPRIDQLETIAAAVGATVDELVAGSAKAAKRGKKPAKGKT